MLPFVNTPSALPLISCISRPPRRILQRTDLSVLSSLDTRNRFSSFLVVVVFLLLSSSSPKTLCILRITINHTHSYDVSFRSFAIFFFLSPPLVVQKFHIISSMMMKKRTTKTRTKKVLLFFITTNHKSKNPVTR